MNREADALEISHPRLFQHEGDNLAATNLMKRLEALRRDAECHGELLGVLCLPKNRDAIRSGDALALARLFEWIDAYNEGHDNRMKSLDSG